MNIFERAARAKLRFASDRGALMTEQLWDLKLTSLDTIARAVNAELKSVTEDGFISVNPDPRKPELELKLDILKHVIADKLAAAEKAKTAKENAEKRKALLDALGEKENEELRKKSKEDILKELEQLS